MTADTKCFALAYVQLCGGCRSACPVSSTASYRALISGSYWLTMAWRRGSFLAVYSNGFEGSATRII